MIFLLTTCPTSFPNTSPFNCLPTSCSFNPSRFYIPQGFYPCYFISLEHFPKLFSWRTAMLLTWNVNDVSYLFDKQLPCLHASLPHILHITHLHLKHYLSVIQIPQVEYKLHIGMSFFCLVHCYVLRAWHIVRPQKIFAELTELPNLANENIRCLVKFAF